MSESDERAFAPSDKVLPCDRPAENPPSPEDMFYGGLYWVWHVPGLGLRTATPEECAKEIQRLHAVIRAAREELENAGGEAEAHLILKHSGVPCRSWHARRFLNRLGVTVRLTSDPPSFSLPAPACPAQPGAGYLMRAR